MTAKSTPKSFEAALQRLTEIVDQLESEAVSLDRSLELFAEGQRLAEFCQAQLVEAEQKVKSLVKTESGFEEREGLVGDFPGEES